MNTELNKLTINEASKLLRAGKTSSVELVGAVFQQIEKIEPKIGAYITLTKELALEQAKAADQRQVEGRALSEIDGIPLAVKDLFLTKGVRTTAASKILEDFVPVYESTPTKKLLNAGMVVVGKTNLDQFAMGSSTETSAYQTATEHNSTTRNPWDLDRIPGGSSGGSAAAVAADMCLGALGTDTGGSIRQPAALCGITGLKPTYGRVSRYGVIAMASSLDQAGPMTKSAEDAALILKHIAGFDPYDSTSSKDSVPDYPALLTGDIKGLKVGVPKEFFGEGMDADVEARVRAGIEQLGNLGAEIIPVSLPNTKYALAVYYIIMPAEVSSNLARYDGIRYGHSVLKEKGFTGSISDVYYQSRAGGFGSEAKRRIMLGSYVLSAGYYDAYYKKAQKVRTLIKQDFERVFEQVDVLATPVAPSPAFKFGEKTTDPLSMYLSDVHTVPVNPAGLPGISMPTGFVDRDSRSLPVGLQLIGPAWSEATLLNTAYSFQLATDYHTKKPEII